MTSTSTTDPEPGTTPPGDGPEAPTGHDADSPACAVADRTAPGRERSGTRRTIRRARRARTGTYDPDPAAAGSGTVRDLFRDDSGMSTVEYAIGTVAAAAFAAILYAVVSGDTILGALTGIVQRALSTTF